MNKLNKEIAFAIAALDGMGGPLSPQIKHEIQMHLRELFAIKRSHLKANLNEIVHQLEV